MLQRRDLQLNGAPGNPIIPPALRLSLIQLVVLLGLVGAASLGDRAVAQALLLGGLVAVIPQAWFAWRLFRRRREREAQRIARAGYMAATGKFFLAAVGFALVFALVRPLVVWALCVGYGAMLIIQIAGSGLLLRHTPSGHR